MKLIKSVTLTVCIVFSVSAVAGEVVKEVEDNTGGAIFGGMTGLLVGGAAAGGPIGSLLGGVIGYFSGQIVQQEAGLSQRAYVVKKEDGELLTVRSPNEEFETGRQVAIEGNRIKSTK